MKNQASKNGEKSAMQAAGNENSSRVLLIAAVILYSTTLVLLANLALAESSSLGALIKVNNQLDGNAFAKLDAKVKSTTGNVMAIDLPKASLARFANVKGVCNTQLDHTRKNDQDLNTEVVKSKYAGVGVVVGILDNNGVLGSEAVAKLKKVEQSANVGFISYVSDNPGSTVIMRNINGGESNLIQALLYMEDYAKTVSKPLVIEMNVGTEELSNPLFVQVCQNFADAGVQFLGADLSTGAVSSSAPVQMAFSTFNPKTGKITDRSDFWAIEEVKQQQIMLLGSDEQTCSVFFQTESGFDKVFMSNNSDDFVMVTLITADGSVNYYHVTRKETALIPRTLMNGTPILEDGLTGVFPFHSKGILFNGAMANKQFVSLNGSKDNVQLNAKNGLSMAVGSPSDRTLAMNLENISPALEIEIKDATGAIVYRSRPDEETRSISTRIDLSSGVEGLYFLDLTSPDFHQTFALLMD